MKEKIAQMFISDWRMAKYPITGPMADLYKDIEKKTDETGDVYKRQVHSGQAFGRKLVRQVQVDRIDDLLHQR